ncbi:hypothetical protein [Peptoniphilus sp.]|uniref:hypothetical protein n=1 Tax=Peptoniphilus sp. TaxID=1971214 RepID=UPI003995BBBA
MFKFEEGSIIVNAWVTLILNGEKTMEEVPRLWNLREVVKKVLKDRGFIIEDQKENTEERGDK